MTFLVPSKTAVFILQTTSSSPLQSTTLFLNRVLKYKEEFRTCQSITAQQNRWKLQRQTHGWLINNSYTGRFIMFSVITNIYNKKTKGPTLMESFTATGKTGFFFLCLFCWKLVVFDVCTTGEMAHIGTIFKFLPHTFQNVEAYVAATWISYRCVPCHPWCTHRTSLVVKKTFSVFPVAVNDSIKVGPLVFLL